MPKPIRNHPYVTTIITTLSLGAITYMFLRSSEPKVENTDKQNEDLSSLLKTRIVQLIKKYEKIETNPNSTDNAENKEELASTIHQLIANLKRASSDSKNQTDEQVLRSLGCSPSKELLDALSKTASNYN